MKELENLVGRKVKCVKRYRNLTEGKEYEIKSVNECNFEITEDDGTNDTWNIEWIKGYDEDCEYHFELLPNEPKFKQGDKVLFTDNLVNWEEGIFLVEHNESYIVESDEMLLYAVEIKPYEEEIKVGDWVFLNDEKGVCKISDKHDLKEVNNKFTLVKDQQLIELLNKEL